MVGFGYAWWRGGDGERRVCKWGVAVRGLARLAA